MTHLSGDNPGEEILIQVIKNLEAIVGRLENISGKCSKNIRQYNSAMLQNNLEDMPDQTEDVPM
ncbi:MAG: hypothetical protein P4N59_12330 [Negativicutes bacterium]|nr:hypothetical protein [Negativicutes bacterium]